MNNPFKRKEKQRQGFHHEDLAIWFCKDCKFLQDNCPWKGSVLDHTFPISGKDIEKPFHKIYPFHSQSQMCKKHKQLFKD